MKHFKGISNDGKIVLLVTLTLVTIGVYMVYSASRVWSLFKLGDQYYYLKRQLIFALIGFVLLYLASGIKKAALQKYSFRFLILSLLLLVIVLIPGLGMVRGGSRSWFGIASFAFQPAELFKIAIIIHGAYLFSRNYSDSRHFLRAVFPTLLIALVGFGLIMMQPDFGTGIVMLASVMIMSLMTKAPIKIYLRLGLVAALAMAGLIISAPYRLTRITAFIDPWSDPLGSGFQIIQSLFAIAPGGLLGMGVDSSIQKYFYLPEPQTDFIFSIIAEEFGLIGAILVVFLFAVLFFKGLEIAKKSKDYFGAFIAIGIVSLFGVQVVINLAVVCGLLPVTGITLPLISYGGSSLTIMMMAMGLLIALSKRGEHEESRD